MNNLIKLVIAVVIVGGAFWVHQLFGSATLAVTSEPSGALVRVNGQALGVTPVQRLELDSGSHRLEVSHSHYVPYVEELSLGRRDHLQRSVTLDAGQGTFQFDSTPSGAWVAVDGERVGYTPMTYTTTSGSHVIAMGQAEQHIVEASRTVNHGQTLEVSFNLEIDPYGKVTITTFPRDAKVEFVDEDIVYAPEVRVQVGEYTVRVSAPGYVPVQFSYQVNYGDNLHEVNLQRDFGTLRVAVTPADADIQVNYTEGGHSRSKDYTQAMQVPVGEVIVRASAAGYLPAARSIQLASEGAAVAIELEPMPAQ